MRRASMVVCLVLLSTAAQRASAADADLLTITVEPLYFESADPSAAGPKAVLRPVRQTELIVTPLGDTKYQIGGGDSPSLWKTVLVYLDSKPVGYKLYSMSLRVPFYKRGLESYALATNVDPGDRSFVQWLRQRNPNSDGFSAYDLYEYFAVAESQFEFFAAKEPGESRDSVRAVYSFGQAAKLLVKNQHVVEARLSRRAVSWLQNAIQNKPTIVENAVGLANAKQLVEQVATLEPTIYAELWQNILYEKSGNQVQYCRLVRQIEDDIEQYPDDRAGLINSYQRLGAIVATAYADCLGDEWKRGDVDLESFRDEVEGTITILEKRRDELDDTDIEWTTRIANRISELVALISVMAQH